MRLDGPLGGGVTLAVSPARRRKMNKKCSLQSPFPGSPSAFFLSPASLLHIGRCIDEHFKKAQLSAGCLCACVDGPATAQKRSITQIVNFDDFDVVAHLLNFAHAHDDSA